MSLNKNLELEKLLSNNRAWVLGKTTEDEKYFQNLSLCLSPKFLWIGCSDARIPANTITGLTAGEVFVHRNVGNLALLNDINCQTVISYSIEVLKVSHVLVVGHYGCGAIRASLMKDYNKDLESWFVNIDNLIPKDNSLLKDEKLTITENQLCEKNVMKQVKNVACSKPVLSAWARKQKLTIHGLVYPVKTGLLKNLNCSIEG